MWTFLLTEIMFFGGLFMAYILYRWWYPAEFMAGSRSLDIVLGTVNTGILIGSSFTMALAVRSAQLDRSRGRSSSSGLRSYWARLPRHQGRRVPRQVPAPSRAGPAGDSTWPARRARRTGRCSSSSTSR
jgi:hypothetical protein